MKTIRDISIYDFDQKNIQSLIRRFANNWEPVPESGCWLWTGQVKHYGHGATSIKGNVMMAHRVSYELHVGRIPKGLTLDHLCRVPGCVNPKHLEPVTSKINVLRGAAPTALNAKKTHCKRGHPLSGDNLIYPTGRRICKECNRTSTRLRMRRINGSVPASERKKSDLPAGVRRSTDSKNFHASISYKGKYKYLGTFPTPELASAAFQEARRRYRK